ncbi:hypothetical protein BKA69DRAFT_1127905 [Paraphysoderma sedebokerense]|nr:hypothetical protein BKA69DRAFT_1127905 [Paraphysoderma sedebokerense]
MDTDNSYAHIDEEFYSHQLYIMGHEAMKKVTSSNVLILGLKGLGIEIAKNVVLSGVRSLSIYDNGYVELSDLSSQFFLTPDDIGKRRAQACASRLVELNPNVSVRVLERNPTNEDLSHFHIVICTKPSFKTQLEINDYTHANGIKFISADIKGLAGMIFCDLGASFEADANIHTSKSLRESLKNPVYVINESVKPDRPRQLHVAFQAVDSFFIKYGHLPRPHNEADATEVLNIATELNHTIINKADLNENVIKTFAYGCSGDLSPMASVIGGIVAQEVLKACSEKFHPISQYFYFDSFESLPTSVPVNEKNCAPLGARYDGQIAVFGSEFHSRIANSKQFLIGAGAIGCEMLKNWAMMGLGTGDNGCVHISETETVKKRNLTCEFLYRRCDISQWKLEAAVNAIVRMNPGMTGKLHPHHSRVGPDAENVFDEEFFAPLDCITDTLDDVESSKYVDSRCVLYRKTLVASGTLGMKGNTQVVIPHVTESYSSSQDSFHTSIPIGTIKDFPYEIEHTIRWARDYFDGLFRRPAEDVNLYMSQPDYLETVMKQPWSRRDTLETIKRYLVTERPYSFENCIEWARLKFEDLFANNIKQLLYNHPMNSVTPSGALFWSAPKIMPVPITFNPDDDKHVDFIVFAANLQAFNYELKIETDRGFIKNILKNLEVPEFTPKKNTSIQNRLNEIAEHACVGYETDDFEVQSLLKSLPDRSEMGGYRLVPLQFEDEDHEDFYNDFITTASNLRAQNYGIPPADRQKSRYTASKIVPAMASTAAVVSGLVCLELFKIVDAVPCLEFSNPVAARKQKYNDKEWTFWDRFEVIGDITLQGLLTLFKEQHGLEVTMLSTGTSFLYSTFMPKKKQEERKVMRISQLVETVSRNQIPAHSKSLQLEVSGKDLEGNDVELPYLRVFIKP